MNKREDEQLGKNMATLSNSDNKNKRPFDDARKFSYRYSEEQPQRTIADKLRESISVKDFGAIGDGTVDDSPAFQAAIDVIKENGGGALIIPQGEYWISQALFLCDNITIIGTGWPTLRKKNGDHGYTVFAVLSRGKRGYGSGAKNITVTGITVRGSFSEGIRAGGFALHHASNVLVYDCRFIEGHIKGHIFDLCACENVTIKDNVFMGMKETSNSNMAECIQLDQSKNGSLSYGDEPGSYDGLMSRCITIQGNQFLPITVDGVTYPASTIIGSHTTREGVYYEDIRILDNYIEDPFEARDWNFRGNIHLQGVKGAMVRGNHWVATKSLNVRAVAIYGVTVGNDKHADPEVKAPISEIPPQGCLDIIIEGNIFEGFNGKTKNESLISILGVQDTPDVTKNVRITGNMFHDTDGSDAIQIKYTSDISVTGNSVMEKNFRFVGVSGTQRLNIEGNRADKSEQQPVWITDASHITYTNNELRNFSKPPRFRDCSHVCIMGNHFLDSEVASGIAFVVESCSEFNAYGNFANTTHPKSDAAIVFKNIPKRGLVHHNIFTGYLHAVIGESTDVLVSDNVV